ncbi:hypothetical protein COOONC_22836 [Cooperia oncophora]
MEDVWVRVFTYLSPREVLKCERVSRTWRRLAHRALRQLSDIDFEHDFPGAIAYPEHQGADTQMIITIAAVEAFSQLPSTLENLRRCVFLAAGRTAITGLSSAYPTVECFASSPEVNKIVQLALRQLLCRSPKLKRFEITVNETVLLLLPSSLRDLSISAGGSLKITNLHFLRGKRKTSLKCLESPEIRSQSLAVAAKGRGGENLALQIRIPSLLAAYELQEKDFHLGLNL